MYKCKKAVGYLKGKISSHQLHWEQSCWSSADRK